MSAIRTSKQVPLDALGNSTRREIVCALAVGPKSVGEISDLLPVSRPAVSKHLRILEKAQLVTSRQSGNRNVFRLRPEGFEAASKWLDSFWDEALIQFAQIANQQESK